MATIRFATAIVYRGNVDGGPVQVVSDPEPWSIDQAKARGWEVVDLYPMGALDGQLYAVVKLQRLGGGGAMENVG